MLECSFNEEPEVFLVLMRSNNTMIDKNRQSFDRTGKYVLNRDSLINEEILRQVVDVSFGDLVTDVQKETISESYLYTSLDSPMPDKANSLNHSDSSISVEFDGMTFREIVDISFADLV